MDNLQHLQNELAFLVDQSKQVSLKIERAEEALSTCTEPLEEATLRDMLCAAQQEHAWLDEMIAQFSRLDPSLSLESLIMTQIGEARRTSESLMGRWKRGRPTPDGYWEAETRLATLTTLLSHYHAWMDVSHDEDFPANPLANQLAPLPDEPVEPLANGVPQPWYPSNNTNLAGQDAANGVSRPENGLSVDPLVEIEDAIYDALDRAGCPPGYVEVVVESPEMVMVRGSARSRDERDAVLAAVMTVDAVHEVLSDIVVLSPNQKPAALFSRRPRGESRPGGSR